MNRRKRNQIIRPKMLGPASFTPLTRSAGTFSASTTRRMTAISTGPPTTMARNTVRRDQSISPSDRSNTRSEAVAREGIRGAGRSVMACPLNNHDADDAAMPRRRKG